MSAAALMKFDGSSGPLKGGSTANQAMQRAKSPAPNKAVCRAARVVTP